MYDATEQIANSRKDSTGKTIDIDDKGVVRMMQKMVVAEIS